MKPEVYSDIRLSISIPVSSHDENTGLMEASIKLDNSMVKQFKVIVVDNHGFEHEVKVHGWDTDVASMTYYGEDE